MVLGLLSVPLLVLSKSAALHRSPYEGELLSTTTDPLAPLACSFCWVLFRTGSASASVSVLLGVGLLKEEGVVTSYAFLTTGGRRQAS